MKSRKSRKLKTKEVHPGAKKEKMKIKETPKQKNLLVHERKAHSTIFKYERGLISSGYIIEFPASGEVYDWVSRSQLTS